MKVTFSLYIMLISTQIGFAQQGSTRLSLSSGIANTSGKEKDNLIGNGYNLQADAFLPFYRKGWDGSVKGSGFELGMIISGNYARVKNLLPNNTEAAAKYNVYSSALTVDSRASRSMSNSFSGLAGIQAQFTFGKLYFSPAISSGYMSFKQEGSIQRGSVSVNGQQQEKDLVKREHENTNGFVFKPQLKVGYSITQSMSFFMSTAIVRGPELTHTTHYLVPEGGFKENNTYEVSQLAKGNWASSSNVSRYGVTEFNIGVSVALGKKKNTQPVRGGGAASASYAATGKLIQPDADSSKSATSTDQASRKSISSKGVKRNEEVAMARPGQPIKGVIVRGGKKPGGNSLNLMSNENGEITFSVAEAGDYELKLTAPEEPAGKSISEKGLKRSEGAAMAKPGNPIGGIIVKGGKNPGGVLINVISNSNGEVMLNDLEAGSYLFILQSPSTDTPTDQKKTRKKEKATSGLKDTIKTQV